MVMDNRSAGPWQEVEYEGYEPLRITDIKIHMLKEGGSLADKQAKLKEMASSELTSFADQQKADAQRKLDEKKKAEQKKAQEKADKKKKQLQNEAKEKLMNLF